MKAEQITLILRDIDKQLDTDERRPMLDIIYGSGARYIGQLQWLDNAKTVLVLDANHEAPPIYLDPGRVSVIALWDGKAEADG